MKLKWKILIGFLGLCFVSGLFSMIMTPTPTPEPSPTLSPTPTPTPKLVIRNWELFKEYEIKSGEQYNVGMKTGETPDFTIPEKYKAWKGEIKWDKIASLKLRRSGSVSINVCKYNEESWDVIGEIDYFGSECDEGGEDEIIIYDVDGTYFVQVIESNLRVELRIYFGW